MPIDINWLRKDRGGDPDFWRENQRKRFCDPAAVDRVLEYDAEFRRLTTAIRDKRKEFNLASKSIGKIVKAGGDVAAAKATAVGLKKEAEDMETRLAEVVQLRTKELGTIANRLDESVPVSNDEENNAVVSRHLFDERRLEDGLYHHHELLWMIGGYEPERGTRMAGHRGYFLTGPGVQLNLALINYGISFLMARKYTPLQPPYFLNQSIMAGVAQLSEFDESLYALTGEEGDDKKYLIATSEQPICGYHKGERLEPKELPYRYAGFSTCFRKEAGSGGRDAWGIFRVHQFEKVEQFVVCKPEESEAMQDEMLKCAEEYYQSLKLPYHVVNIVSGELNNAAAKKYDLEAWFPVLKEFRELVSCSNCYDYQSRSMDVRCGTSAGEEGATYVHMLNATLVATTRTICCILENYQTPEGVVVPEVLVPFMGGVTFLPFVRERPDAADKAKAKQSKSAARKAAGKAAEGGNKGGKGGKGGKSAAGGGGSSGGAAAGAEKKTKAKAAPPAAPAATAAPSSAAPAAAAAAAPAAAAAAAPAAPKKKLGADGHGLPPATLGAPKKKLGADGHGLPPTATVDPSFVALDAKLLHQAYIDGHAPSAEDAKQYDLIIGRGGVGAIKGLTNLNRWFEHVGSFTPDQRAGFGSS